jgi:D-glycero-D-manno-heptose 1,7-bisphosphate phosphatase
MVRQAFILCGGAGARLGALTTATPKPLLPIGDRPFLDVLLFALGRQGVAQVVLLAAFEAGQIEAYAHQNGVARQFGMELEVMVEPTRAGTGGALHNAGGVAEDEFFLLNGDSWFDIDLGMLVRAAAADPLSAAILALRPVPDASRYGVAVLDQNRVLEFHVRPTGPGPGLVNAGVYLMRRSILRSLAPVCSLEKDVLPGLAQSRLVGGVAAEGFFLDIGVPDAYLRAQQDIPVRMRALFCAA